MKVAYLEAQLLPVSMRREFHISYGTINQLQNVFVKLVSDTGVTGFGEASAIGFISGDTNESVLGAVGVFQKALKDIEMEPASIHAAMDRALYANFAAKAAIDMALYDCLSKEAGLPLHRYLGAHQNRLESDVTLGIDTLENSLDEAKRYAEKGFRAFKLKANGDTAHCAALVRAMTRAIPYALEFRIDANQGWDIEKTLAFCRDMEGFPIAYIEQPVDRKALRSMAALTDAASIPIMADESVFDLTDAHNVALLSAAKLINIKLMKCGGIFPAIQIALLSSKFGIPCGIGCMMESELGLCAALSVALSCQNIVKYDLDSVAFVACDALKLDLSFDSGTLCAPSAPGLGLEKDLW